MSAREVDLDLQGFQPAWVQPYVIERLPILIRRGVIDVQGEVALALRAQSLRSILRARCALPDFACVDRAFAQGLAAWKYLNISGVDCSLNPVRIMIREIGLTAPSATFIILPDGQSIVAAAASGQPHSRQSLRPTRQRPAGKDL